MALEFWDIAADRLRKSLGNNNYKSWIEPLQFVGESAGTAEFFVPTSFFGNYVRQHFEDQILYQMRESGFEVTRVTFSVGRLDQEPVARPSSPAVVAPVKPREIQGAKLDKRFVFGNFVVGKPNELAHAAAKRVAEAGPVTFNPLFLYGGVGLGKTHLMHSIAWELQSNRPDINVMYLSAEQFMYRFVQALRERKMMDFKELFRSVDVLMVDDVQFIGGKDSTQEEFFHTFNALVDQNKQIIISADRAPGEIKQLEDRIASRLQCGLVVDLHPTTYELRLGILQSKIELYQSSYPGIDVRQEVVEFLAHRISTNVRVLEGALTRLFAFASLVGREITVELTQDCL
ncbi:chromosomal replication initiator protein DnaA, partial [Planktomarina temperata]|uniref:chromosomal replication initiator protein DnaA n=2 Tax=Planktomarina temperata TaxID=1284658 RepID=UPI0032613AD9|nr:chromosomal replication initiator protein DnaA [Planktomarina temperata]